MPLEDPSDMEFSCRKDDRAPPSSTTPRLRGSHPQVDMTLRNWHLSSAASGCGTNYALRRSGLLEKERRKTSNQDLGCLGRGQRGYFLLHYATREVATSRRFGVEGMPKFCFGFATHWRRPGGTANCTRSASCSNRRRGVSASWPAGHYASTGSKTVPRRHPLGNRLPSRAASLRFPRPSKWKADQEPSRHARDRASRSSSIRLSENPYGAFIQSIARRPNAGRRTHGRPTLGRIYRGTCQDQQTSRKIREGSRPGRMASASAALCMR